MKNPPLATNRTPNQTIQNTTANTHTLIMTEVERLLDCLPDYGSVGFEITMHDSRVVGIRQSRTKSIRSGEAA